MSINLFCENRIGEDYTEILIALVFLRDRYHHVELIFLNFSIRLGHVSYTSMFVSLAMKSNLLCTIKCLGYFCNMLFISE